MLLKINFCGDSKWVIRNKRTPRALQNGTFRLSQDNPIFTEIRFLTSLCFSILGAASDHQTQKGLKDEALTQYVSHASLLRVLHLIFFGPKNSRIKFYINVSNRNIAIYHVNFVLSSLEWRGSFSSFNKIQKQSSGDVH